MENRYQGRSAVMGGFAKALNAGGSAAVYTYDLTASTLNTLFKVAKNAPVLPQKVIDIFTRGLGKPTEVKRTEEKINEYEMKIKNLYFEIGKAGAGYEGEGSPLEGEPINKLVGNVREYEKEIERLRTRITEVIEEKKAEALRKQDLRKGVPRAPKRDKVTEEHVTKTTESAIEKALKQGEFKSLSEQEIFNKVAHDLLDSEIEVRILAAAELGKIEDKAAVPILLEAVKFNNPDLTSEIINSLITIGDSRAIPLFKEEVRSPRHQVRAGCLRGLYKLATDEEAVPILIESLQDQHPKVRRTAATFIGWKDYAGAVPALVQSLNDEDTMVRKAAVSALANIKDDSTVIPLIKTLGDKDLEVREKALEAVRVISGEEIAFDLHASGRALTDEINNLRDRWQKERMGKLGLTETADVTEAVAESAPPEEALAPEEKAEAKEETAPSEEPEQTEENLMKMIMKMTKAELLALCKQRGIECDEKHTKRELTQLILGEGE
jgi:HEAT repeat protein